MVAFLASPVAEQATGVVLWCGIAGQALLARENKAFQKRVQAQRGRDQKALDEQVEEARRQAAERATAEKAMAEVLLAAENKVRAPRLDAANSMCPTTAGELDFPAAKGRSVGFVFVSTLVAVGARRTARALQNDICLGDFRGEGW